MNNISRLLLVIVLVISFIPLYAENDEWLSNEVLMQLSEIRREMGNLKKEVGRLGSDLDSLKKAVKDISNKKGGAGFSIGKGKSLGKNPDAKFAIVEFTDYECPYCARYHNKTWGKIKENYVDNGKMQYFVRDFPLSFHRKARGAAIAAGCADVQGDYANMHDELFINNSQLGNELYSQLAQEIGLDINQFEECLKDGKQEIKVESDIELGQRIGVKGTPAFFIGRFDDGEHLTDIKALSGAQPFSSFKRIIDSVLNQ